MRILYVNDDINTNDNIYIKNQCNEIHKETIFGLDNNNNIIQHITFPCEIEIIEMDKFKNTISSSNEVIIENGYLFYSFTYEMSYCHYLCQTVPKLYEYLNTYKNYKLLIPEHRYNNLCKNILNLLNIDESDILILKHKNIYVINDYIITNKYGCIPSNFTHDQISIYKKIREKLNILPNVDPLRKVYLKRDGHPNSLFGNSETGILRQITNENELIEELIKKGFEIITLGNKYIDEKSFLLNNIKILITPLGANCMNFIFCNSPHNIIYLSNTENFGNDLFSRLSEELNDSKINSTIVRYPGIKTDPLNPWNNSFSVDIKDILNKINDI